MTRECYEMPVVNRQTESTGNPFHDHQLHRFQNELMSLLAEAEASGIVITVSTVPLSPAAMRNYVMVGHVRAAR
jgi:hypothetical protein